MVHKKLDTKFQILTHFQTYFTEKLSNTFAIKQLLKNPPHLICFATN